MAVQPKCACQVRRACVTFTPGQPQKVGWTPSTSNATQNVDFVGPTQVAGVDSTPFSIDVYNGKGSVTVPFYNLPAWTRGNPLTIPNQLRPWRNQLRGKQTYVQPMNQLFFDAQTMNIVAPHGANVTISVQPRTIDSKGIITNGPIIGGGRIFSGWQVVVSAQTAKNFTGKVSGTAIARLHHIFG